MTGSNNYYLRLNEFEGKVKISWQEFQMEKDFCDVTLACEDKQINAHKLIISSFSSVLRNILKLNQTPHPIIYLRRVKYRNLQNLLRFMYQGEVGVNEEDLPTFLEVAEDLNVRVLCEKNTDNQSSNEEDLSLFTNPNIHESSKKKSTENNSLENVDDSVGPFNKFGQTHHNVLKNEIDTEIIFSLEEIVNEVENTKQNMTSTVAIQNPVHNDTETKSFCAQKEVVKNTKKNLTSTVAVKDAGRSHPCGQCGYKSKHMPTLRRHVKSIHEGERYPCDQCNYKATFKSDVKKHIKSIHEGVRYPCDQCNYKSTDKSALRQHVKSIHEGELYPCNMCDHKSTRKDHLRSHQLRKHN